MKVLGLSAALLLLGSLSVSLANDTVDNYMSAIQGASTTQERAELMNEFKTVLSTLGNDDKISAMKQLQEIAKTDGMMIQTQTQAIVQTRQKEMMNAASKGMVGVQNTATSMVASGTAMIQHNNTIGSSFRGSR